MSNYLPTEAEGALLGSMLVDVKIIPLVLSQVRDSDFHLSAHKTLYAAIRRTFEAGLVVDPVVVLTSLKSHGDSLELQGGDHYVLDLMNAVPCGGASWQTYVDLVLAASTTRKTVAICTRAATDMLEGEPEKVFKRLVESLTEVSTGRKTTLCDNRELRAEWDEDFDARTRGKATGLLTGIGNIDNILGGINPGNIVIIAGDVGSGKSSLADQIAAHMVLKGGATALSFSLEMTRKEKYERAIANLAKVDNMGLRSGRLELTGYERLRKAQDDLDTMPLHFVEGQSKLRQIEALSRCWRTESSDRPGVLVVDFVQLVDAEGGKSDSRAREVGRVAYALKSLVSELGICALVLSQLNRGPAQAGRKPTKHDLKESGDLEASADVVALIHNPLNAASGDLLPDSWGVELLIDKHRNGPTGLAKLTWIPRYFRFESAEDDF